MTKTNNGMFHYKPEDKLAENNSMGNTMTDRTIGAAALMRHLYACKENADLFDPSVKKTLWEGRLPATILEDGDSALDSVRRELYLLSV